MRKYFVLAIMSVALFSFASENAFAQSKKLDKIRTKEKENEYKRTIKRYHDEGWKLAGDSRSLEVALLDHYEKTNDPKNKQIIGEVTHCKSMNICRQAAINNAQNAYASLASAAIKGRITSMLRQDDNEPETEMGKMIGAYEKAVQADVSGILVESYSIVKDNGDGTKWFQTFFIINEEEAASARARAMEKSLKETKISVKEAEEISKFVQEGFNLE
jgi:hypothetical protein